MLRGQAVDQEALALELQSVLDTPVEGASRRMQRAIESPQAVEVITGDQIRASGAFRIADVLRMATSLQVWDLDGDRASVTLRGVNPSGIGVTVQVLLDGIPLYNNMAEPVDLNGIPVPIDAIEKIEIVRGPSSSLYGANAQMGVISITTRRAGNKPEGSLREGAANKGIHHHEGFCSFREGAFALTAAAGGDSSRDLGRPQGAVGGASASLPFQDAAHGAQAWVRPELVLDGLGRFWAAYGYGDAGHGNTNAFELGTLTPLGSIVDHATSREVIQAGWKQVWSPTFSSDVRFDQKTFRQSMAPLAAAPGSAVSTQVVQTLEGLDPNLATQHDLFKDTVQRGTVQANWDPSSNVHVVGGFDASKIETGASPALGISQDATYTSAGGFLSLDWTLGALALSGGARAANESLGGSSISPRVSAVWTLDDASVVRAGFYTSTRSPMVLEKYGSLVQTPFMPFYIVRAANLQSEKTTDYELGYRRNWSILTLDATAYHTVIRRLIMLAPTGSTLQGAEGMAFQNRSGAFSDSGVELAITAELGPGVVAGWNGSTSRFKDPVYGLDQQADYSPKAQSSLWLRARQGIWFGYAALQEMGSYTVVIPGGQGRQTVDARLQAQFNAGIAPSPHWSVSLYGINALREAQPVSNMTLVNQNALSYARRELGLQASFRF